MAVKPSLKIKSVKYQKLASKCQMLDLVDLIYIFKNVKLFCLGKVLVFGFDNFGFC